MLDRSWRPLRGPVLDWPLGVCDTTSVNSASDLVPTDNIWSYAALETYNVFHNPDHSWYYVSNQTSEDVILFKGFDSAEGVPTCKRTLLGCYQKMYSPAISLSTCSLQAE